MEIKYEHIMNRRKEMAFTDGEQQIATVINRKTKRGSLDNISRTELYLKFFERNKEVRWAFLASMVSRNAGWNMTDLKGRWYPRVLSRSYRKHLFFTYERANWLIFVDAYPQLLLYEESKRQGRPLFHLLKIFRVSIFMEMEWEAFWHKQNKERLCTSQIINEQQLIQKPVIEHHFYKKKVFQTIPFHLQDWLHFSTVIFPTSEGRLYGFSVHQFSQLKQGILLGRRLAWLLFCSPEQKDFQTFADQTVHTGTRYDYQRYVLPHNFGKDTPFLRAAYPVILHSRSNTKDWYKKRMNVEHFFASLQIPKPYDLTDWYQKKRKQLQAGVLFYEWFQMRRK